MANSSLTDRSSQLTTLHKDVELKRSACDTLEENLQHEKVSTACRRRFRLSFCYLRRGGCVFTGVSVCLLAGLRKNHSTDFRKIRFKGGTWAIKPLDFGGNPDRVTLGLRLGLGQGTV